MRSVIGCARVSYNTQEDDLERQVEYLRQRGVQEVITDMGSGLNEKRKGFLRVRPLDRALHNEVGKAVILHEDRLTRFGSEALKKVFEGHGTTIEVLNQADAKPPQQELVEDPITIISHFSGELYGMRSHKQKEVVKRAKELFAQA